MAARHMAADSPHPRTRLVFLLSAVLAVATLAPVARGRSAPPTVMRSVAFQLRGIAAPWTQPTKLCAPIRFNTVGFVWEEGSAPSNEKEEVRAEVRWGARGRVVTEAHDEHAPDPGSGEGIGLVGTDPVWTGDARCLTVRLDVPAGTTLQGLRAVFVNTSGTADPLPQAGASALTAGWRAIGGTVGASPAEALTQEPTIITRAGWGADESLRNCDPEYADRVKMAFVHHTAGKNTYRRLAADDVVRGIYAYHTQALGWCDVGYNFLVDRFGRIYEGRTGGMTEPVIGAHAMGFNTGSTGVSVMGNFVSHRVPRAALDALTRVLAWRLDVAHVKPTASTKMVSGGGGNTRYPEGQRVKLKTVSGHRDTGLTACPGDRLYAKLASLRTAALNLGLPKVWQTKQRPGQIEAGLATVRWTATLSESLPWLIEVTNESGIRVAQFGGAGNLVDATWDGRDALGVPVADGFYRVTMTAGTGSRQAREAVFTLQVGAPAPSPSPTPSPAPTPSPTPT